MDLYGLKLINKNDNETHDYLETKIGIDYWVVTYSHLEIMKIIL